MSRVATVLLAGASGLVGSAVLQRVLACEDGPRVLAPVRRPLAVHASSRLVPLLFPSLSDSQGLEESLRREAATIDAYVCCLGTTLKKAGSREAFLAVDRDLTLQLAAMAHRQGARQAILVSSVGASAQSGNFYLRVKGETERALCDMGFDRVDMLRPGLLLGKRSESRPGESLGRVLTPFINPLMRGPLRRYRSISADTVASAALALLRAAAAGRHIHENADLVALAAT